MIESRKPHMTNRRPTGEVDEEQITTSNEHVYRVYFVCVYGWFRLCCADKVCSITQDVAYFYG
ncbi:MAG TPA: hypothetical protein DCE42_09540 [Myxococcales bacterium]|nr:hypothetical protein [Deltaproteobacteria bacterium]MBU51626.1 hypothetical protein [Deltaproteobacteria bacterium]HAA54989.1 hypothetical protein [Myxococcales bacterium]